MNSKLISGLINKSVNFFQGDTLFQWRFKLTSTNNNVGTNELEAMPFKVIVFKNKTEVLYELTEAEIKIEEGK